MATPEARFKAYDFDGNEQWKEYLVKLTFPAGREDLVLKKKAQWYKREIDPEIDIDAVLPAAPKTAPATAPPQSKREPDPPQPRWQSTSSTTGNTARAAPSSGPAKQLVLSDWALLFGHIVLVVSCILALQPLNPFLSHWAFAIFSKASLFVHGYRLYKKVGLPSMANIKPWAQQAASATETFYLLTTMILAPYRQAWVGLIPMAILALYHISATLNSAIGNTPLWKNFRGAAVHRWLSVHQQQALQLMALMEVGTGMALGLLGFRNGLRAMMNAWMYFTHLRTRFWLPESRQYHVMAWQMLGRTAAPVLSKIGFLNQFVNQGVRWFQAPGQQQHAQ